MILAFLQLAAAARATSQRGHVGIDGVALTTCLGPATWQALSLPRQAWLEAGRVAQQQAHLGELPADTMAWSPRALFTL